MRIHRMRINHIKNPLGYMLKNITAAYVTENLDGMKQESAEIIVSEKEDFSVITYTTGRSTKVSGLGTKLDFPIKPRTRYYWKVYAWDEKGNSGESGPAWFETGLMDIGFKGECIAPDLEPSAHPVFFREFDINHPMEAARLYMCGLGVYEVWLNGKRAGNEFLAPGLTVFEKYVQYQTYDISEMLISGKNIIEVRHADGWYKGKYGYRQNHRFAEGKEFMLLADLYIGESLVLCTDRTWNVRKSKILFSDIYDGEYRDDTLDDSQTMSVKLSEFSKEIIKERMSLPVTVKEMIKPKSLIKTPAGEWVLDMGQNMTGRVVFHNRALYGHKVSLEHGEVLQDGCFYNKNYRTAKAQFVYISDGKDKKVCAQMTFFGFQYVRLIGFESPKLEDFYGEVLYSDLEQTGELRTGHNAVNQLISNILWSQKGNFLEIPTDCPQRDEKMGWTGDAQIFAGTASLNMECYAFFRKYLNDIALEQEETGGLVPQIVPSVGRNERTSAAWGDAATIIPWALYRYYGDKSILEEQYQSMEQWIAYIDRCNYENKTDPGLWKNGFHYGDWLALDGGYYHMPTGGTDVYYVASAYFYHSVNILAKVSSVCSYEKKYELYSQKAENIKAAIQNEYFTGSGRLSIDTQSAYIIAIVFGLYESEKQKELIKTQFLFRLRKDGYSVKTGFVGTPFILQALSECGCSDLAYYLLLNEQDPGWLYPLKLGATTMWERWDALDENGHMSDSGMNSLNHYANGAIQEWMYNYMAGIRPREDGAGFKKVYIEPHIHPEIGSVYMKQKTASGTYEIEWKISRGRISMKCVVPFDVEAEIHLPFVKGEARCNGKTTAVHNSIGRGEWLFEYELDERYQPCYNMEDSVRELIGNRKIKSWLYKKVPMLIHTDGAEIQHMTLKEMSELPFFLGIGTRLGLGEEVLAEIEEFISKVEKRRGN